jgi:ferritin-like protein
MNRAGLLRGGVGGGAALLGLGVWAERAAAAVPDIDLSYLRLLVATELLKADFAAQASASGKLGKPAASIVQRMRTADNAHYTGLAALMNDAGQPPATADDIDFSYPRGSFSSAHSAAALAWKLTSLALGAYLGALEQVQTPAVRLPLAQIAANEAQQQSALAPLVGRQAIGGAFAAALPIDVVSAALDAYES